MPRIPSSTRLHGHSWPEMLRAAATLAVLLFCPTWLAAQSRQTSRAPPQTDFPSPMRHPVLPSRDTDFLEKHLADRLPQLSLSTVRGPAARPISVGNPLDAFLKRQIRAIHRNGWQVRIIAVASPSISPFASRPDPATRTVKIGVATAEIAKLSTADNFAFSYFWLGLLHELENAARADEFVRLSRRAQQGSISRRDFVEREIQLECQSFTQALRTYRQDLIPLIHRHTGVALNDFSARWPRPLTAAQARILLRWDHIEAHYEGYYDAVKRRKRESRKWKSEGPE